MKTKINFNLEKPKETDTHEKEKNVAFKSKKIIFQFLIRKAFEIQPTSNQLE
jgi:hypothetical protein